jgi:hypothetical protein
MVKRRHKPISPSEIITIADQQRQKKVGPPQRLRFSSSFLIQNKNPGIAAGVLHFVDCA